MPVAPRSSKKFNKCVQYSEMASQKLRRAIGKVLDDDVDFVAQNEENQLKKKQAEALLSSIAEDKHDEFFENKTFKKSLEAQCKG